MIRWATDQLKTEKDMVRTTYLKQIVHRGNLIVASTQKCDGYMRDLEEYLAQLSKRGLNHDFNLQKGQPEPAEVQKVLRTDGVSGGGSAAG